MCVVKNLALAIPLILISIPALAGTLIINNKSCLNITDVSIVGAHQVGAIGPGATGNFNMDNRCSHVVHGTSNGTFEWNEHFQCQGVPYGIFTLTWSARNKPPAAIALSDDSLIVETSSGDNFGEVKITSKLDCVTIEKLVGNRGNCNTNVAALPAALKFGQTLTSNYFCSKLLELNVITDQGNALFTWTE